MIDVLYSNRASNRSGGEFRSEINLLIHLFTIDSYIIIEDCILMKSIFISFKTHIIYTISMGVLHNWVGIEHGSYW
jgi:hypothetical protein